MTIMPLSARSGALLFAGMATSFIRRETGHDYRPSERSEVQWAHRIALTGISDRQYGHSFVEGADAHGASSSMAAAAVARRVLIHLTIRKSEKATTRKSITLFMNSP